MMLMKAFYIKYENLMNQKPEIPASPVLFKIVWEVIRS